MISTWSPSFSIVFVQFALRTIVSFTATATPGISGSRPRWLRRASMVTSTGTSRGSPLTTIWPTELVISKGKGLMHERSVRR